MLLLVSCILVYCLSSIGTKEFSRRFPGGLPGVTIQNAVAITVISLLMLVMGGAKPMSGKMLALAAVYGVVYLGAIFSLVFALLCGPMGTTALIGNLGTVLSVFYGTLFCGEKLTVFSVCGAACLIAVASLCRPVGEKQTHEGKKQARWFALTLLLSLGNGILACLKKSVGVNHPELTTAQFMFWAYSFAALACWGLFAAQWRRAGHFKAWLSHPLQLVACAATSGLGSGGGSFLQIGALKTLPTIVVFPCCTGLIPVVLMLTSVYVYKETKLTARSVLALALCGVGAVLMNL